VALGLVLAGAGTAVATVGLHQIWWGFVLAFAATFATAFALPPGWWGRLAFVVGWAAMVGWLTIPRDEGDYLVSSDLAGYAMLGLGLLLVMFGVATLPRPRMRP
jgi:hypothetical protein